MQSPYRVSVAKVMRDMPATQPLRLDAPFDAAHEFAPRGRAETDVASDAPVSFVGTLQSYPGGLSVHGELQTTWHGVCRRCSAPVTGELRIAVAEQFRDQHGLVDEETYPIEHDHIDLAPLVHDAIFLELPLAPLCRPDCQGLCPECGADKNEAPCECPGPVDPRWATLDALRFDEPDGSGA